MFDERDFIARQFSAEEQMAEAARERLLHKAIRERQLCAAKCGTRPTDVRAAFLLRASRLLVRAGQRLETLARPESPLGIPATDLPSPTSPAGQRE